MDPIIEEMSQTRPPIRPDVFFRWVDHLRQVVQPKLDAYDLMAAPVAASHETKGVKR